MGGNSESRLVQTERGAAFRGTLTLKGGGGFASVRAPETTWNWSDYDALDVRHRGDGRHYWLTTYTHTGGPISYRAPLSPSSTWTTTTIRFSELTPYRRGRRVPEAPPFAPSQVRTLGLLIADKQEGPFHLDIAWIRLVEEASGRG